MAQALKSKETNLVTSLTRLSQTTYIHNPTTFTPKSPTILLFTWMNASPHNISFYIQHHISLFPSARILLLRGIIPNMIYSSESTQKRALQPVLHALLAEPDSPLFLHLFSNSGAQQTGLLLRTYKEATKGKAMPVRGMIFDSTPSIGTMSSAYAGLSYEVPKKDWRVRIPGLALVCVLLGIAWLIEKASGRMNVIAQLNYDLRDKGLLGRDVVRWYFYSREDRLVRCDDVEWHAREVERKGWVVHKEIFEGSAHCRHAKDAEEIYWGIVKEAIEQTCLS